MPQDSLRGRPQRRVEEVPLGNHWAAPVAPRASPCQAWNRQVLGSAVRMSKTGGENRMPFGGSEK